MGKCTIVPLPCSAMVPPPVPPITAASLALGLASFSVALTIPSSEVLAPTITRHPVLLKTSRTHHRHKVVSAARAATSPSHPSTTSLCATDTMSDRSNEGGHRHRHDAEVDGEITTLGFGSLLSLKSARLTFPTLRNFRLGRVPNHRRVFAHPASIFFQRGIANMETLEMSSLSCEYVEGASFVCSVFEVPNEGLSATRAGSNNNWVPSQAYLEREEEFEIAMVQYEELTSVADGDVAENGKHVSIRAGASASISRGDNSTNEVTKGVICRRSTDEAYVSLWGEDRFKRHYADYNVNTIWGWERDSGLRPCATYLRHCVLASWNFGDGADGDNGVWSVDGTGGRCYNSFLDETFLVDRKTTVREYLKQFPDVMTTEPPEGLRDRYGG